MFCFKVHNFLFFIILFSALFVSMLIAEVRVIDGDTMILDNRKVRLFGIDAPEKAQLCQDSDGNNFKCGIVAGEKLSELIFSSTNKTVNCENIDKEQYGRLISNCWVDKIFINSWMVRNGWALAYERYSKEFIKEETEAKIEKLGVWNGQFVEPWNWRKGIRIVKDQIETPKECLIKGNISSSGEKIYHVPGGQYYSRTKISKNKGEIWFCSEEDAIKLGWRKSKR